MRSVLLMRRRADAEEEALVRLTVAADGGPATVEILVPEMREGLEEMIAAGTPDGHGHLLTIDDGAAFLNGLLLAYRGSRFWAEEEEDGSS